MNTSSRPRSRSLVFATKAMGVHVETGTILVIVRRREQASMQSISAFQRCIRSIKSKPNPPDVFGVSFFCSDSIDFRLDFLFRGRRFAVFASVCAGCNVTGRASYSTAFDNVFSRAAECFGVLLDGLSAWTTVTAPQVEQHSFLVCGCVICCLVAGAAVMHLVRFLTFLQDHPAIKIDPQALQF